MLKEMLSCFQECGQMCCWQTQGGGFIHTHGCFKNERGLTVMVLLQVWDLLWTKVRKMRHLIMTHWMF